MFKIPSYKEIDHDDRIEQDRKYSKSSIFFLPCKINQFSNDFKDNTNVENPKEYKRKDLFSSKLLIDLKNEKKIENLSKDKDKYNSILINIKQKGFNLIRI